MRKARLKTTLLPAILLSLTLAPALAEGVELRLPRLPNVESPDPAEAAEQRVLNRFLELNPGIHPVAAQGISLPNMVGEATTIMMIAGGEAPDVLTLNFRSFDTYVRQGLLAPVDDDVINEYSQGREITGNILPQVRDVVFRPGPDGITRLYGVPGHVMVMGLYFNKDIFRKAGLPQRAPRDWPELLEFARRIKALEGGFAGLFLPSGSIAAWNIMAFVWPAGGEAVVADGKDGWRAAFDSPEAVEAYAFYYDLVEIERVAVRAPSLSQELRARTGMFFGYAGEGADDPRKYGFGAVPAGPHGGRGSEINAPVYGVYSQIRDPAVRDAAWRYVFFVTSPEAERIRVETLVEMGEAARISPDVLRRNGFGELLKTMPEGFEAEYEAAVRAAKPEPYGKNCNLVYQEMSYPIDQMLLDEGIRKSRLEGDKEGVFRQIRELLGRAAQRTNERMIGYVPPEEMRFRRLVAGVVVVVIFAVFVIVCWRVGRIFSRAPVRVPTAGAGGRWVAALCLTPALGLIFLWSYLPLVRGTAIAFQDYRLVLPSSFVGVDNFASALFDPSFWNAMLATLHFAAYTLTLGFVAPLVLAYALHLIPKHKVLFRTLYYLPAIISGTAVFFLWNALFGADGPLNHMLQWVGVDARRAWTEDPHLAMLSCVIPGIWAGAGPGCLIYLAALKTIPQEQFEASEIDGAGFWQKTIHLVIPELKALIFINFIGAVIAAFHGASNILIMTGGGPNGVTEVMSLKIFFESFTRLRFGPATAMAWILGSLLVGLTIIQLKRLSNLEFKAPK